LNKQPPVDWLKVTLGGVLLGGVAWFLLRSVTSDAKMSEPNSEKPPPRPPLSPSRSYEDPARPGHEIFIPEGFVMPSQSSTLPPPAPDEIALRSGKKYRARLQLTGFERLGSRGQIADTFSGLGFTSVAVYMNQGELPGGLSGWPMPSSDDGARWVEGVWSKPDTNLPKPPQVLETQEI
jgi:hypothetical protein